VDHLRGDLQRALARNKDDAAPVCAFHRRQVTAGEAHPAQNIDLEEPKPVGVRDLLERLRLKDAEVVDQDVNVGMAANQFLDRRSRPKVPGESNKIAAGFGLELSDRLFHAARRAAGDDDTCSFASKARRYGGANARGAACHKRPFEFEVHADSLSETRLAPIAIKA